RSQYQLTLQGTDTDELYDIVPVLLQKLRALPQLTDLSSDLQIKSPTIKIDIDREQAASIGVSTESIQQTLYNAYGSRQISTIYTPTDQYLVMLELKSQYQSDPSALSGLYVRSQTGGMVPLGAIATITRTLGPLAINHSGQMPSVT